MTISVDWENKIINIQKEDMTLIQTSPSEVRQLDLDGLRLQLRDLEDSPEGVVYPRTHDHNQPVDIGGVSLARVVSIVNGYTVTFEDDQYAVNLVNANTNLGDRVNVNQVSIRTSNSAGLIFNEAIEDQSFMDGRVYINSATGITDTAFPAGTPVAPVQDYGTANIVATNKNFIKYDLLGMVMFVLSDDVSSTLWYGNNPGISTIVFAGNDTTNLGVEYVTMTGQLNGQIGAQKCLLGTLTGMSGIFDNCVFLAGLHQIDSAATIANFTNCSSGVAGVTRPELDINGATAGISIRDYTGGLTVTNMTAGNDMSIDVNSGTIEIAASCTSGTINIRGVVNLIDNSGPGCTVVTDGTVTTLVDEATSDHATKTDVDDVIGILG